MSQCRAQAYDGASNMSEVRNIVQAICKREAPRALYVHCLVHNLQKCTHLSEIKWTLFMNLPNFTKEINDV